MAIKIICGEPGIGKTSLLTWIVNQYLFDRSRYKMTVNAIAEKNKGGFDYSIPPLHSVFANFLSRAKSCDVVTVKFGTLNHSTWGLLK